jgi:ATP-dependent Lon protease
LETNPLSKSFVLPLDALRWRVDESTLAFESTSEIDPAEGIIGQPVAMEALRFGVESKAPGQNIYVRGTSGTGRTSLVRSLLAELDPQARRRLDRCYVHNFLQPDQPRLITLPSGQGPLLRRRVKELAEFIENRLLESLDSEPLKASRDAISKSTQDAIGSVTKPLEEELKTNSLALVRLQTGQLTRTAMFPLVDGQPVPPEELAQLLKAGKVTEEDLEEFNKKIEQFAPRLQKVSREANKTWRQGMKNIQEFFENEARAILQNQTSELLAEMPQAEVKEFITEVIDDVIENRIDPQALQGQPPPQMVYGVNVICSYDPDSSPVVTENTPTVPNLLGSVEPEFIGSGQMVTNYRGIRAGALVHADGGYLILDAYDVLSEPGSWRMLMRALRTGSVEIVPSDLGWPLINQSLKPQAIDISVRIILIGSSRLFYQLDQFDQDFTNLFKVLADFNSEIERSELGINQYASVVARICRDEDLVHFDTSGVAALAEHGARIASRKGKITARFGRIADIAREASFLATKAGVALVGREHVESTIIRNKYRASLPSTRFQELIHDGTIMVQTRGSVVGQINGLAVINAGQLSYGFPARITATIGAGQAGVINIEGAAALSGSIHTKGFHILGGLLRHLLHSDHPLAFSASIAFEQSYGGIDGDSASGAEICCLISALTGVPIRQGLAMTGAIDQHGHIQAIGGVNEKIEGFFDACIAMGLNDEQGIIIPWSNAGDLMLREDVVKACAEGHFKIHAVRNVSEALEVLTGKDAGQAGIDGKYPEDSLLGLAQLKATDFWHKTMIRPEGKQSTDSESKEQ